MITDDKATVRNKKLLEQVRSEGEDTNGSRGNDSNGSEGYVARREGSYQQNAGRIAGTDRGNQGRTQGDARPSGIAEGRNQGVRQVDGADIDTVEGAYPGNGHAKGSLRVVETPQEKEERQKELARQRLHRFRDRQREEKAEREAQNVALRSGPQFNLKLPFGKRETQKVKLFTDKEAGDEEDRMKDIYFRGSGLLDDILEIIVKDHEEVQIWQLSEEEAEMLAGMHLERAKKDEGAARSARKLLEIYDRLYIWMIAVPRMQATGRHVQQHKGFSFR
jgi:hypothetical protein